MSTCTCLISTISLEAILLGALSLIRVLLRLRPFDNMYTAREGSHSGLVRAPAKRLACESGLMGSNPIPSARIADYPFN